MFLTLFQKVLAAANMINRVYSDSTKSIDVINVRNINTLIPNIVMEDIFNLFVIVKMFHKGSNGIDITLFIAPMIVSN